MMRKNLFLQFGVSFRNNDSINAQTKEAQNWVYSLFFVFKTRLTQMLLLTSLVLLFTAHSQAGSSYGTIYDAVTQVYLNLIGDRSFYFKDYSLKQCPELDNLKERLDLPVNNYGYKIGGCVRFRLESFFYNKTRVSLLGGEEFCNKFLRRLKNLRPAYVQGVKENVDGEEYFVSEIRYFKERFGEMYPILSNKCEKNGEVFSFVVRGS